MRVLDIAAWTTLAVMAIQCRAADRSQDRSQAQSDAARMAATVEQKWPAGMIATQAHPGSWTYETGTLLDGMVAVANATGDPAAFAYVNAAVDRWVDASGRITTAPCQPFRPELHTLDNLEPGRAVLAVFRTTHDPRYATAAKYIFSQFAGMPRNRGGGYWHKQVYPNQMWLDGAYMAEPFRAAYASTFHLPAEFDDIAAQFLLMHAHMRDNRTGLLRHGWDESRSERWADKETGMSKEVWARAMGWYMAALADTLPYFPKDHPRRRELIRVFHELAANVAKYQDSQTGLWWDVMDKGGQAGNFTEASASAMLTYALAKGARLGYLEPTYRTAAVRGWKGIQAKFVTRDAAGRLTLHGTVKVSGLGGTPYRAGDYAYYVQETVVDDDARGVGAYLLAASEMVRIRR